LSCWFQDELPFPGVDLSLLKPKEGDVYPEDIIEFLEDRTFENNFLGIIVENFKSQDNFENTERTFRDIKILDQYNKQHLLPSFLTKVSNKDQSELNLDEEGFPVRGIRTFGEIAHYIRCLPFRNRESYGMPIWCSPDFTLDIKIGTEFDHALLMASLFRTVKHETQKDFNKWTKEMKKAKKNKRVDHEEKILKFEEEGAAKDLEEVTKQSKLGLLGGKKMADNGEEQPVDTIDTIDERVFVCYGMSADQLERQIWVMTIDKNFKEITFWDVKQHKNYVLKGRVKKEEFKYLGAYLSPKITKDEREQIKLNREMRRQMSIAESMADFKIKEMNIKEKVMQSRHSYNHSND
jgi:hypothetical protein